MPDPKEQIVNAYNNVRDCALAEFDIKQKVLKDQLELQAAHKLTQMAKSALADLEI